MNPFPQETPSIQPQNVFNTFHKFNGSHQQNQRFSLFQRNFLSFENTSFDSKGNRRPNSSSLASPQNEGFSTLTEKLLQIKINNIPCPSAPVRCAPVALLVDKFALKLLPPSQVIPPRPINE